MPLVSRHPVSLPKRAGQLDPHELIDAVVPGSEVSVLHVAHHVLREDRIALPEPVGDVDPTAQALLPGTGGRVGRAPDDRAVEVDAQHQVWGEARAGPSEVVPTVRTDEGADHVPARPVSACELRVIERLGRASRILEASVQPILPEEPEKVYAADSADRYTLRQEVRRQEVADADARPALSARVVPVELPVEPKVPTREV